MTLDEYLTERGESDEAFGKRAGLARSTVWDIRKRKNTRILNAAKVVRATGGLVSFSDMIPEEKKSKRRSRAA